MDTELKWTLLLIYSCAIAPVLTASILWGWLTDKKRPKQPPVVDSRLAGLNDYLLNEGSEND